MEPEALATTAENLLKLDSTRLALPSRLEASVLEKVMHEGQQEASGSDLKVLWWLENATVRDFHSCNTNRI